MGNSRIVAHAIQANPQIRVALMAALTSSGLASEGPFPAAFVAVAIHEGILFNLPELESQNSRDWSMSARLRFFERESDDGFWWFSYWRWWGA